MTRRSLREYAQPGQLAPLLSPDWLGRASFCHVIDCPAQGDGGSIVKSREVGLTRPGPSGPASRARPFWPRFEMPPFPPRGVPAVLGQPEYHGRDALCAVMLPLPACSEAMYSKASGPH